MLEKLKDKNIPLGTPSYAITWEQEIQWKLILVEILNRNLLPNKSTKKEINILPYELCKLEKVLPQWKTKFNTKTSNKVIVKWNKEAVENLVKDIE